jgi:WD40 repeat protein
VFSFDSKSLFSGGSDGVVREWDIATGELKRTFSGHEGIVRAIVLASAGKLLASGGDDGTVRLWEVSTCKELWRARVHSAGVLSLSFVKEGSTLVSASLDGTARVLNADTGQEIRTVVEAQSPARTIAFASPDGRQLATMSHGDSSIRLWSTTNWKEIRKVGRDSGSDGFTISPDGHRLLTFGCGAGVGLVIWDIATGKEVPFTTKPKGLHRAAAFSPDGKRIVVGGSPGEHIPGIWDVEAGKMILPLAGHFQSVNATAYSPNGKLIATAGEDGVVRLFDAATGRQINPPAGHQSRISALAITPDAKMLVSGGWDRTVRLWGLPSGKPIRTLTWDVGKELWRSRSTVGAVSLAGDGKRLAASELDGSVRIWFTENGELVRSLEWEQPVQTVVLNAKGDGFLVGRMDSVVETWEVKGKKPLQQWSGKMAYYQFAILPDQETFVSLGKSDADADVGLRSLKTGELISEFRVTNETPEKGPIRGGRLFGVSADGKTVIVALRNRDRTIPKPLRVFDAKTNKEVLAFGDSEIITAVSVSPDGKVVAVASDDGTLALWDGATGERKEWFSTGQWGTRSLVFSPDGAWLYSSGDNGTICGWKLRK